MTTAQRSYLIGMHNPVIHSTTIIIGWIRLFKHFTYFTDLCTKLKELSNKVTMEKQKDE